MTYIYAYSNHKYGLSRLRRMAVLYQRLQDQGVEVEMLTNDFRAASAICTYGVPACTTIETVWDIDFVAERGDSLILDTPEDDAGKLAVYVEMFKHVTCIADREAQQSLYGEELRYVDPLTDPWYAAQKAEEKVSRTILFYGDSDPKKSLVKLTDLFENMEIELLLGEYFYPGYEAALEPMFSRIHEAESYREIIAGSKCVISCVAQTAYEASTAGANVIFLGEPDEEEREIMEKMAIKIVDKNDQESLQRAIL